MNDSLDAFAAELEKMEEQQGEQKVKREQQSMMVKTEGKTDVITSTGLKDLINKGTKIDKLVFNVFHNVDTVNN